MYLEVNSPKMLSLFRDDAAIEKIATGFLFTEGPIWNAAESALYFSDMPGDVRRRWSEHDGVVEVRRPANKCNGMTYDGAGNLYVCEHVTSRVVKEYPDGRSEVLASHWQGKELNSPNDIVVRSDGSVYFSDPPFGRTAAFGLERKQVLDFQAVFRVSPAGELSIASQDFATPNGLCFSPDERLLYVNDTRRANVRVFDVAPDGNLTGGDIFAKKIGDGVFINGTVDGMKCDMHGNVYVTGPRGIWIFSPAGEHLGVICLPEHAGNHNWGGKDWNELYCACTTSIYRLRLNVQGSPAAYMKRSANGDGRSAVRTPRGQGAGAIERAAT